MIDLELLTRMGYLPGLYTINGNTIKKNYPEHYEIIVGDIKANNLSVITEVVDQRHDSGHIWVETKVMGKYPPDNPLTRQLRRIKPDLYKQTLLPDKTPASLQKAMEQHEQIDRVVQTYFDKNSILQCQN